MLVSGLINGRTTFKLGVTFMHRFVVASLVGAGLSIGFGSAATAADLSPALSPVYTKAPPPSGCIWCGWYVGVNAGGTWPNSSNVRTTGTPVSAAATFAPEADLAAQLATNTADPNKAGFIGGAQLGYNYEFKPVVFGLEADIQGVANKASSSVAASGIPVGFPTENMTSLTTVSRDLDYFGTVRGRVGFEATPMLLLYGTGGLAYGGVKSSTTIAQSDTGIIPGNVAAAYSGTGTLSDTRVGWTAGGGLEWMFARQWSAKAEYLYYDLGSVTYNVGPLIANAPGFASPTWVANAQSTTRFNGSIARVGVSYHF